MTTYQPGQRIALVHTSDPYTQLRPADTGTVRHHDQRQDTVYIRWDNGSTLAMCLDAGDQIQAIPAPGTPADSETATGEDVLTKVQDAAARAGRDAADWWAQDTIGGHVSADTRATARHVLTGIGDSDPAVLDALPHDDPPARWENTLAEIMAYPASVTDRQRDAVVDAYRLAFDTAVVDRVTELCQLAASPTGRDVSQLHPDRVRVGSAGVFTGDWAVTGGPDGDRIDVAFAGTLIDRWNGWAVFSCTHQVAEAIVADQQRLRRDERTHLQGAGVPEAQLQGRVNASLADLYFDGDTLIADQRAKTGDEDAIDRCSPDIDGRYVMMGWNWCWQAVDPYLCDTIIGDLPQPGEQQQFELLRHTPGMRVPHTRVQLSKLRPSTISSGPVDTAFTAVLTLDGETIAAVTADGHGTITLNPPDADTAHPALSSYLAGCRHHGRAVTTVELLQALADQHRLEDAITRADADGTTLLRLIDDTGRTYTLRQVPPIAQGLRPLLELGDSLTRQPGRQWQAWTGRAWLTVPTTGPASGRAGQS